MLLCTPFEVHTSDPHKLICPPKYFLSHDLNEMVRIGMSSKHNALPGHNMEQGGLSQLGDFCLNEL